MKKVFLLIVFLGVVVFGLDKIATPTDYATVTNGTRANLKANFSEVETKFNSNVDTVVQTRGRFENWTTGLVLKSKSDLRLRIDDDATETGRLLVEGSSAESLFTVREDSTWKAFGAGRGTKITLSDSILAATANFSGLTASLPVFTNSGKSLASNAMTGTGSVAMSASPTFTGTVNLAAIAASGNATVGGTLGVTGALTNTVLAGTGTRLTTSTSAGVLGNATTIAGTNEFTDLQAFAAGVNFSGNGTTATATIFRNAADGLSMRGVTGSTYDLALLEGGGSYLLRNPQGGTVVEFPGSGVTMAGTLGVTGITTLSNTLTFGSVGSSNAASIWRSATEGLVYNGISSSTYDLVIKEGGGSDLLRNPQGGTVVEFPGSGVTMAGTLGVTGILTASAETRMAANGRIYGGDDSRLYFTPGTIPTTQMSLSARTGGHIDFKNDAGTTLHTFNQSGAVSLGGTLGVTGVATFTAAPVFSSATVSTAAEFDASKNLVSATKTGTGNDVYSASPTLTGTIGAASATFSGTVAVTGNVTADSIVSSKFYTQSSFTATLTGCASATTGTATYTRIGTLVTLTLPSLLCTSNSTAALTVTGLPAAITPNGDRNVSVPHIYNNSTLYHGAGIVQGTNQIYLGFWSGATTFTETYTASGSKGWSTPFTITYNLL